jgi:hypothetical protein
LIHFKVLCISKLKSVYVISRFVAKIFAKIYMKRPGPRWQKPYYPFRTKKKSSHHGPDAYSRRIAGWSLQPAMHAIGPLETLQMALKTAPLLFAIAVNTSFR